ncbi:Snakin-1 [Ranunculus cassubicifolius]
MFKKSTHFMVIMTTLKTVATRGRVIFKKGGFCDSKCKARCAKAGMKDRCLKYCGICCQECKCVPSGTYGNKDECPCYRDMKNSKGKDKCP